MEKQVSAGYIYIVATPEFWRCGREVYKVGSSRDVRARARAYPKGTILLFTLDTLSMNYKKFESAVHKKLKKKFEVEKDDGGNEYYKGDVRQIYSVIYKYWNYVYKKQLAEENHSDESSSESQIEYSNENLSEALEDFKRQVKIFDDYKLVKELGEYGVYQCIDGFWTYLTHSDALDNFSQIDPKYKDKLTAISIKFLVDPDLLFEKHLRQNYYDKDFRFTELPPGVNLIRAHGKKEEPRQIYILNTIQNQLKKLEASDNISNKTSTVITTVDVDSWEADLGVVELVFHNEKVDDILLAEFVRSYRRNKKAVHLKMRETFFKPEAIVVMLRLLGINSTIYGNGVSSKSGYDAIILLEKMDIKTICKFIASGTSVIDLSTSHNITLTFDDDWEDVIRSPLFDVCLPWLRCVSNEQFSRILLSDAEKILEKYPVGKKDQITPKNLEIINVKVNRKVHSDVSKMLKNLEKPANATKDIINRLVLIIKESEILKKDKELLFFSKRKLDNTHKFIESSGDRHKKKVKISYNYTPLKITYQ